MTYNMIKKIKTAILQNIGDALIAKIETCETEEVPRYYEMGLKLEKIALYFNVILE